MTLSYKTASGQEIRLNPIAKESFVNDGVPVLKLSGREWAAMSTARVLRAAQANFEFPTRSSTGAVKAGRQAVARDELRKVVKHKNFDVFEDGDSLLVRMVYRELVLRLHDDVRPAQRNALLKRLGLAIRRTNPYQPGQLVAIDKRTRRSGAGIVELAMQVSEQPEVAFATPNFVSQYRRSVPAADALKPAAAQWHLGHVHARQAWALEQGSRSIAVAILDDGIDIEHPELRGNLKRKPDSSDSKDLFGRDFFLADDDVGHYDPRPKRFRTPFDQMSGNDIHGTPCAGVAVGRGPHAYGLAPRCRLLPVKVFHADDLAADERVADAIRYAGRFSDVLSCSWTGSPSPDLSAALADVAAQGRDGRGAVVVCATGNDQKKRVGFPARDPNCIGVGASTDEDKLAWYSNVGPEVCVVAPSNGGKREIFTTDVSIAGRGFNVGSADAGGVDGLFTNSFGGTSSATPLVAGLVALMLSANRSMTPADVRRHLTDTAVKIGPASGYDSKGHSDNFGHGRIDAAAAVAAVTGGAAKQAAKRTPGRKAARATK